MSCRNCDNVIHGKAFESLDGSRRYCSQPCLEAGEENHRAGQFNPQPESLFELVQQAQEWEGPVKRVIPYFGEKPPIGAAPLGSVGIVIGKLDDDGQPTDGEYELLYELRHGHWRLADSSVGDLCTRGGSAMTGPEFG